MDTAQIDNMENMENYILHGRGEIIQKLKQLVKTTTLVSIHFNGNMILTSVLDVLTDKNLVVLDFGADEAINNKLLECKRAVVKTSYQGITAQFTIDSPRKARLKGNLTFACPIPDSILWVQRRESYRVRIPLSEPITCKVFFSEEHQVTYRVMDISTGGLALFDTNNSLELEPGNIFNHCQLSLGSFGESNTTLEVRNHIVLDPKDLDKGTRCGCQFLNLSGDFSATLQKYINTIDIQQNR